MRFAIGMTDIAGEWDSLPQERQEAILKQHEAFEQALRDAGRFVEAVHFYPREESVTVRMDREGGVTRIDGPFSDAPEYLGGFYLIEADSMEEAVEWARKARFMVGANEVRRVWE